MFGRRRKTKSTRLGHDLRGVAEGLIEQCVDDGRSGMEAANVEHYVHGYPKKRVWFF